MSANTRRLSLAALALAALLAPCLPARAQLSFRTESFDPLGSFASEAYGVSASGTVSGIYAYAYDGVGHGYLRANNGAVTTLDYPGAAPGSGDTYLRGTNSAGTTTGYFFSYSTQQETHFIYQNGAFRTPTAPGATATFFNNVNEAGLAATVYQDAAGARHSAVYDVAADAFTLVPDIAGYANTNIQTVAPNGDLLINVGDDVNLRGALVRNGVTTFLDFPSATVTRTAADAITADGLISGNYLDATGRHGFLYDSNRGDWHSIDYPGAAETWLYFSNNANTFVGRWFDGNGLPHSLRVTAVPEPGALALFAGVGTTGLLALRRRARGR